MSFEQALPVTRLELVPLRPQFRALVLTRDPLLFSITTETLSREGYRAVGFVTTLTEASRMLQQDLPHLLLIDGRCDWSRLELEPFLQKLTGLSREVMVLWLGAAKTDALSLLSDGLLWDVVTSDSAAILVAALDRAILRLLYQFRSEELANELRAVGELSGRLGQSWVKTLETLARATDRKAMVELALSGYSQLFFGEPALYLRWSRVERAFVVEATQGFKLPTSQRIGLRVSDWSESRLASALGEIGSFEPLIEFIRDGVKSPIFYAVLHGSPAQPEGIFVVLSPPPPESKSLHRLLGATFELVWSRSRLLAEMNHLPVKDVSTGLLTRRHYFDVLEKEFSRARRIEHPLSVAFLGVRVPEIEWVEPVMKVAAEVLTSRLRRLDEVMVVNGKPSLTPTFGLVLPHTPVRRAQDLARQLATALSKVDWKRIHPSLAGLPKNWCAAVGEYPSHAVDPVELTERLEVLLGHLMSSGGLQTDALTAEPSFRRDFDPGPGYAFDPEDGIPKRNPGEFADL